MDYLRKLSEKDIEEFRKNPGNLNNFFAVYSVPENIIREFVDIIKTKNTWDNIAIYQQLSEGFIREFIHKLDFIYISWFQRLSKQFIIDYFDKLSLKKLLANQNLSEDIKNYIRMFI